MVSAEILNSHFLIYKQTYCFREILTFFNCDDTDIHQKSVIRLLSLSLKNQQASTTFLVFIFRKKAKIISPLVVLIRGFNSSGTLGSLDGDSETRTYQILAAYTLIP